MNQIALNIFQNNLKFIILFTLYSRRSHNLVLFMLGTIDGLTSGVALAIAVAFGTAIFMILIDLAQLGFNLDLYMEQRGSDSYDELTGYFLAQVAEDAVYNFLLVNFMKFAKKAKIKIPSKVSNGVNKLNDKIKDAANTVANKLDDMINKGDVSIKGIPLKEYEKYIKKSRHNVGQNKIMLGKYDDGMPSGYIKKAGKKFEYFDLGKDWNKIKRKYNLTDADMFELFNKPFLDEGIASKKTFHFSHNPVNDIGALGNEFDYLINNDYIWDQNTMTMSPPN